MAQLDPHHHALERIRAISPEFLWTRGIDDVWRSRLREKLASCIGLGKDRPALRPSVMQTTRGEGFHRETVTFPSLEGFDVFAHLLVPRQVTSPAPAVICFPGHGPGVEILLDEMNPDYQAAFAMQSVRNGFVTLAVELAGFGRRKSAQDADLESSCQRDSMAALMLGETMIGWRVRDAIASLDYLLTRPEVDPRRISSMGISGGGLVAFWAACLDERFAAAVVSGYFNTFLDSILSINHCVDNFAPGLSRIVEMPDMAALIAPRRLFVENAEEDPIFPVEAFRRACGVAEAIYGDAGVPGNFGCDVFAGGHQFSGRKAIPQLKRWMGIGE